MLEILSMKKVLNLSGKCSVGVSDGSTRVLCLQVKLLKIEYKNLELEDEDILSFIYLAFSLLLLSNQPSLGQSPWT